MRRDRRTLPRPRTARGPWRWAATGAVLGLLVVLLAMAPARWLATALARGTSDMVQLLETRGSVWNGSAVLVFSGGRGSQDRTTLPGRVRWRIRPALTGPTLRLAADCCTPDAPLALQLKPRWTGMDIVLADSETTWPAAVLAGLGTPLNTIRPQGELKARTQGLLLATRAGRLEMEGSVRVTGRDLSSQLSPLRPLGSYQIDLQGDDGISLQLSTLEGKLLLSGAGSWVGGRFRFTGEASAAPGMEAQLVNLLNIIGRRQGDRALISFG